MIVKGDREVIQGLGSYFTLQNGYEVVAVNSIEDALHLCRVRLPNWIVLDWTNSDLVNDENNWKIFFSCVDYTLILPAEKRDVLMMSPHSIVFKPFQVQELINLIKETMERYYKNKLKHPITFLPSGPALEMLLRMILHETRSWKLVAVRINNLDRFFEAYGANVGNDVLRDVALMLEKATHMLNVEDLLDAYRRGNIVVGHIVAGDFLLFLIPDQDTMHIKTCLEESFGESIGEHSKVSISLSVGAISNEDGPFSDIIEMVKMLVARLTVG